MANDALDPGPNGDYPFLPRHPDGAVDLKRMPLHTERRRRDKVSPKGETHHLFDLVPGELRNPDGTLKNIPGLKEAR